MIIYYRDARVQVTSAEIRIDDRRYPLGELSYVWHGRCTTDLRAWCRRAARWLLLLATGVLVLGYAVKTPAVWRLESGVRSLPARILIAVAASFAVLAVGWPLAEAVLSGLDHIHLHGVRTHEIRAFWRGEEVLLLRTSDALLFGRVYRALERALEHLNG
jgi:hypothetical protein